ncbi:MAG: FG-GAP-like repeat-containing protein [Gammaproteobacteria bacterium]
MKFGFKTATVAAFAAAAGLAFASPAQAAPSIYPGALLPGSSVLPGGSQMVSADFNGDGLMDLAVADDSDSGTNAGGVWIFLAQAGGGYAAPVFYPTASDPWTIAVGDLNGDGKPDIVTGNEGSSSSDQVSVLIGNGDGTFKTHVDYTAGTSQADSITVGDATGNGTADVVLGTDTNVLVIPGNGDGTLDTASVQTLTLNNGYSYGVAVTDLNADGQPDIVAADGCDGPGTADTVDVYVGQSGGTFLAPPSQTVAVGACPELAVGDLNGDGAPDVAVANYGDSTVQALLNSAGVLADSGTTYPLPADSEPLWAHVADVDGDGHLDILTSNYDSDTVSILYGQGDGSFTAPVEVPMGAEVNDVAAVPAASGSAVNLVALDWPYYSAFLTTARNLGSRTFYTYADYPYFNASGQGQAANDMASADFNGDGHPDIVTANGDNTLSVLLNNGQGGFGTPTVLTLPSGAGDIYAVAAGDVNGDGKADILTADNSGHLYTFLSNGDGTFQAPLTSTIASSEVDGIALGDVNGDGEPDVAVAEYGANQVQICPGDGTGHFDCTAAAPVTVNAPYRVTIADLTGNGKADLVVTTGTDDAYVYLGDGTGGFGASPSATLQGTEVAVGDVNGDGKPDLVFGSYGTSVNMFLGNGDGTFGAAATYESGVSPEFVALADVNGDGHPDIVAANDEDGTLSLLTNKGDGTFNAAVYYASGIGAYPMLALDVDGDGLPDIVTANYGGGILTNSTVSVYLHNHAPVATGTSLTVNENASGTGTVTATDAEQDPLTFAVATQPGHGTVSLDATSGSFTYTPSSGYSGSDSFTVTATNGLETSAPATVSITVKAVTPPPTPPPSGGGGGGGVLGLLSLLGLGLLLAPALRRRRG